MLPLSYAAPFCTLMILEVIKKALGQSRQICVFFIFPGYDPKTAMKRRTKILSQICDQFSDPINPEFLGLYRNYFDSVKMEMEPRRTFSLGHSLTSCVPDFPGNEAATDFFNRIGVESDETDSMDPCSAFQVMKSAEPDRSNEPIQHPDYPGR